MDKENFTIRILSWKRPKSLLNSLRHHSTCQGVAQIQVVWSDLQGDVPQELSKNFSNGNVAVTVEHRSTNALNNRFDIQSNVTMTRGIFSLDDDLLVPCQNLMNAFTLWTRSPDRMVSFAPRDYGVKVDGTWKYIAWAQKNYSLGLTNAAFLHRDYLHWYTKDLPRSIYTEVDKAFNCEDIAMSLFVSSLTNGKPPLIAPPRSDKMHGTAAEDRNSTALSAKARHYQIRSSCVERYATTLGLKGRLQKGLLPNRQ